LPLPKGGNGNGKAENGRGMKRKLSLGVDHHACAYLYNNLSLKQLQLSNNYFHKIYFDKKFESVSFNN
jgi:hypothetical protein